MRKSSDQFPIVLVLAATGLTYALKIALESAAFTSFVREMASSLGVSEAAVIEAFVAIALPVGAAILIIFGLYKFIYWELTRPMLEIVFDDSIECKTPTGRGFFLHAKVYNRGIVNANNCVAVLEQLIFEGESTEASSERYINPLPLGWASNFPDRFAGITIPPAKNEKNPIYRLMDVVSAGQDGVAAQTRAYSPLWFRDHGDYRLVIQVTSDNAPSASVELVIPWKGNYLDLKNSTTAPRGTTQ